MQGIANNSDDETGKQGFYQASLRAIMTLIKNFSGEELHKMASHISKIVSNIFKSMGKNNATIKKY